MEDLMIEAVNARRVEKFRDRLSLLNPVKSLLVIEDDLSMVQFVDAVIVDHFRGLEWEYVTSGEAALELIRRRASFRGDSPYSLVMTDIFLEGETTGFDVWLECQELYPGMPFVVTSHLSFDRYFSIIRGAANCPVYLPKPLTVGSCQSVLDDYF
jgi:response regulator of citrate/malate metabolism